MKHLEQQILDLITDEVFAKRLANEIFIAMQKNDIYEQVKFESRESIEENIKRFEKQLEQEKEKLTIKYNKDFPKKDITIPKAKEFNELQRDVDDKVSESNSRYSRNHKLLKDMFGLSIIPEYIMDKVIIDNMFGRELIDIVDSIPLRNSIEISNVDIVSQLDEELFKDILDRISNNNDDLDFLDNNNRINLRGGGCSLPKGLHKNIKLEYKSSEQQGIEKAKKLNLKEKLEDDTVKKYRISGGGCVIGLGKSEAEKTETLKERAKKAWEKFRNK